MSRELTRRLNKCETRVKQLLKTNQILNDHIDSMEEILGKLEKEGGNKPPKRGGKNTL